MAIHVSKCDSSHANLVRQDREATDFHRHVLGNLLGVVSGRAPLQDKPLFLNQDAEAVDPGTFEQSPLDERFEFIRRRPSRTLTDHAVFPAATKAR